MKFIDTDDDGYINLDHVVSVGVIRGDGAVRFALYDKDGNKLGEAYDNPANASQHVLAAAPGFFVLFLWDDDAITAHPVIGWRISPYFGPLPLIPGYSEEDMKDYALEYPDGRVEMSNVGVYATRDEWRSGLKAERAKQQAREKERAAAAKKKESTP